MRGFIAVYKRLFSLRGLRSSFVQAVGTTLLAQVSVAVFALLTNVILARALGPAGKGSLALVSLVINVAALVVGAGMGAASVYFVASRRMTVRQSSGILLAVGLITGCLGALVVGGLAVSGVLSGVLPGIPVGLLMLGLLALPLTVTADYFAGIAQGRQRILQLNLLAALRGFVVAAVTGILLLATPLGVTGAVAAMILGAGVYLGGLAVLVNREGGTWVPSWNTVAIRRLLGFGLRAHVGNLVQFFNYRLDMFLVNYFLGPAAVGVYTVAVLLAELLWYLPNAVGFVIFPKAANTPSEVMSTFTPRVFRATLSTSAIGALVLVVTGRPAIGTLFSAAFLPAYEPMLLLLPGVVLLGGAKVLTNELAGRGYPHYNSITAAVALVITLAGDLVLIPRYGITGAAVASSLAYATICVLAIAFHRMTIRGIGLRTAFAILFGRG